jgi:2-polyprenyl-6-methoxyphenol hydroxylase-like FAD-dependent oxidoreductase
VNSPPAAAPVVIVGAGPVGLLLASELGRAGVPVVIVERLASPMTESRASQLTALTAELLAERGLGPLLAGAGHEPRAHFAGFGFDLSGLDSDYPGNWKVPQYRTEAALADRAAEHGVRVLRSHELIELAEEDDHVACGVVGPRGYARIRARYVVGCDGARSSVRRLAGFAMSATAATRELLRADVTGLAIRDRRFERLEAGFAVASTRDGVTRVMVHAAGQAPVRRTGPPEFGEVAATWAKVTGEDISGGTPIWLDCFDNSSGLAERYRRSRVLLAGDAAHWHLPIGGQALNVGLQDAVNLGWKLAGTVHGWAAPGLLDSYHDERHAAAARVLDWVLAQEMLLLGGAEIEPLRSVLAELTALRPAQAHLAMVASNLGDRYGQDGADRWPALVGRRIAGLRLRTETGPLRAAGTEPVLVRVEPASGARRPGIPAIRAIDDRGAISAGTTILLRPDGYVAWAGPEDRELDRVIETLLDVRKEHATL